MINNTHPVIVKSVQPFSNFMCIDLGKYEKANLDNHVVYVNNT